MKPLEYLHLQLRLEGKDVINGNRLRQVEFVPDEEMPLMVIAQLADGQIVTYFDESLPPELRVGLKRRCEKIVFPNVDLLLDFLNHQNIRVDAGHYKTYVFSTPMADVVADVKCLSQRDPRVQAFGFGDFAVQVYAIERDEKIVSACVSARENQFGGEAWVYTDENYRRQGFAGHVVTVWAKEMARVGKIPFYSHKIHNTASAHLAMHLGLQSVFEEIVISHMNV